MGPGKGTWWGLLDQIRGRSYEEALMILEYTPYRACELIIKTLVSVRP